MATEPVDLDGELLARVREVAGESGARTFIEAAIRRDLDNRAFGQLLDELEAEGGPVPDELLAEAERVWRGS